MKKLIALALVLVLSLTLASALAENKKIVIGATPSPHVIILEQIVEDLKASLHKAAQLRLLGKPGADFLAQMVMGRFQR